MQKIFALQNKLRFQKSCRDEGVALQVSNRML